MLFSTGSPEASDHTRRYYTQKRLSRASKKLGIPELIVYDQFEDRRVGLRFCTFVTPVQNLGGGCKVTSVPRLSAPICTYPVSILTRCPQRTFGMPWY